MRREPDEHSVSFTGQLVGMITHLSSGKGFPKHGEALPLCEIEATLFRTGEYPKRIRERVAVNAYDRQEERAVDRSGHLFHLLEEDGTKIHGRLLFWNRRLRLLGARGDDGHQDDQER